ncbi:uncharacterized protein LOC131232281 [Magnolia sinica]|uniref:uncharacterized protein LOC131232281 n=1 Tax=Magnolia sinica TaxID=86752 RepID=UPI00265846AB|nr:uncharacterized protein LOC131232281 [Magnolia sinica]
MGLHGCSTNGQLDNSKFSEPMPWIGLYVAAASMACTLAMACDAFHGLRNKKLWFPNRNFSLNATSLALLTIATKLPVDLNTSMPRRQDQLAKLSGTVLICTVMGNFMPSLGVMEESEMLANFLALCILVITVVVNIGIQIGTGVIYVFIPEHAAIMFIMLVLLVILGCSALTVPTTKQLLEQQFKSKHRQASDYGSDNIGVSAVEKQKEDVKKFWVMAATSNPQYVLGRSALSTASGAFCLLAALILVEAVVRSLATGYFNFCSGESDYKWSSMLILMSQAVAVAVGTIAPALRWFNAVGFHNLHKRKGSFREEFRVEMWWILRFVEAKEKHLPFGIGSMSSRRVRKIAHISKNRILDLLIAIQTVVVLVSKSIRMVSVVIMCFLKRLSSLFHCMRLLKNLAPSESIFREGGSESGSNPNLRDFVLHLEGEDSLVRLIARNGCECMDRWIRNATKREPTYLVELLKKSTASEGFKGVGKFDSDQIPSITWAEPPNCWALPVVTLTSIAVALPNTDPCAIKSLLCGVHEGLRYVRLVEKTLDAKGPTNMKEAADSVWVGVDVYNRWLNENLYKFAREGKCSKKVLEELADIGRKLVLEFTSGVGKKKTPLEWPPKVLAANSMYRVCQTILQDYNKFGAEHELLEWLQMTIADILAACFTNLPGVISMKCLCSAIEVRTLSVVEAASLLGEAENILGTIGQKALSNLDPNQMACIDEWRLCKKRNQSCVLSSDDGMCDFSSDELSLYIE